MVSQSAGSLISHLSLNCEGRRGTTDDSETCFLRFSLFSTALWDLPNSRPGVTLTNLLTNLVPSCTYIRTSGFTHTHILQGSGCEEGFCEKRQVFNFKEDLKEDTVEYACQIETRS